MADPKSWFESLFGRILNRGTPLDTPGAINFASPLTAVVNEAEGRIDVEIDDTALSLSEDEVQGMIDASISAIPAAPPSVQRGEENPGPYSIARLQDIQQQTGMYGVHHLQWQDDGSTFYVASRFGSDLFNFQIDRYTPDEPWALGSPVLAGSSSELASRIGGSMFYVVPNAYYYFLNGSNNPPVIVRRALDTPWDVSDEGAETSQALTESTAAQVYSLFVTPGEDRLIVYKPNATGGLPDVLEHYEFGTPGDVSTLSLAGTVTLPVGPVDGLMYAPKIDIAADGTRLLISGPSFGGNEAWICEYKLSGLYSLDPIYLQRVVRPLGNQRTQMPLPPENPTAFYNSWAVWGDAGYSLYLYGAPGLTAVDGDGQPTEYRRLSVPPMINGAGNFVLRSPDGSMYEMIPAV